MIPYNTYAIWNGASDTAVTSLELYNPKNDLAYIIFGMLGSTQYGLNEEVNVVDSNLSNMQEDITELKNSVSDGKAQVASAITDKGVATASNATFNTMATNIRNIQTERTYPNGFFKRDSLTDVTNSLLTILPSQYAFTNIDMTRSWRIYDDLLNNGFNVHSLTTTTETVDDTTVTYRTFKLSPPGDNNIGYIFSYTDSTLTSVNRYTVNLGSFSSIFSASTSRFLIKKIKNSYCIIRFIDGVTPTDYTNYVHFLSNAYDSNAVLFGCLFEQALLTSNSFDFSLEGGTNNGTTSNKGQSQTANANDLFIQDLYSSGINTSTLVTPFYVDSLYFATVFPTSAIHTESYIFKSDDEYEFLLLPVNGVNSNYRPIRIK